MRALSRGGIHPMLLTLILGLAFISLPAHAAFITFENCLSSRITDSRPKQLQFTPSFVDATFLNTVGSTYVLNLTIFGNVSGSQFQGAYPLPSDPQWKNDNESFGKITNVGTANKLATLTAEYNVLTYTAYKNDGTEFCNTLVNGTGYDCPLGPAFYANASDPSDIPRFTIQHDFGSSYAFSTISTTVHVISGDTGAPDVACISAQISPDLGPNIAGLLTWLPAAILILKGIATLSAAIWSPWGTSDVFKWSSNYGRDEDLLRLVTPGFGDCLQYIQFVVLTGSLTLQYPGFFQPAVSQASWSTLLFNESYVTGGDGRVSLIDGLYATNATYGLTKMSQYIGMSAAQDIWACMAIWLVVIAVAVVVAIQIGFFCRWAFRAIRNIQEEDLRQKNVPFTLGNIIRLVFNYFILPIVALSLFQLVISTHSPASVVACAVVLLLIMIVWAAFILRVIFRTKPRAMLFDDLTTVLLYGPLYNTYSDSAAPFALIPVFITFMRGVAIGAVQPSGIAQIIILAICEVILVLTLNGFRPFQGQTSMNLYHTFFALARLATILLMIAFVPTLGVTEAPRGWIGYIILLIHACVLVFGFFLNSAQTIIEVIARSLGAGHDAQNGAIRGSVLNWRTLKKRPNRTEADRASMMSSAAMLRDTEGNAGYGTRSRSISASSQQLLNRMSGFENFSSANENLTSPDPDSSNGFNTMTSSANGKSVIATKADGENYYRPPRPRKATVDAMSNPGIKTRSGADFPYQDSPTPGHARDASYDSGAFGSPQPAYFRARHDSAEDANRNTDYAVREVDQYYRGPALNDQPSRKLKTGPADPEGPASTAQTWFQRMVFGVKGKKKDQSKGFEVVRSSRMPPGMQREAPQGEGMELQQSPAMREPYRDSPQTPGKETQATAGAERSFGNSRERSLSPTDDIASQPPTQNFDFGFEDPNNYPSSSVRPDSETIGAIEHPVLQPISTEHRASMGPSGLQRGLSQVTMQDDHRADDSDDDEELSTVRHFDQPVPMLNPIDSVGGIDLPSRFNSTAGSHGPSRMNSNVGPSRNQGGLGAPDPLSRGASHRSGNAEVIGNSQGGQDWLRAVENLEWNHDRQPSTRGNPQPRGSITHEDFRPPPPSVPRRNARRTHSQEQAALRSPYQPPNNGNLFEGFDSDGPTPDGLDAPAEEQAVPAPAGQGHTHNVSHHRAADSITRNSFGANAALNASSAAVEYLGETPPQQHGEGYLK
ncbi:hypothetical protein AC578_1519 [Lecanosticta acicola]|uniref:ML-like domain-containing protein n=1 Tax=Lecanosticta acicola TaxID=111012 RepID=A0AAI8Z335_9PEZI|nr:hypothetical protein AC578_1519 [Lecanosticta acicola]